MPLPTRRASLSRLRPDHVFFYGTLMRGFPLRVRSCIDAWIRFVGHGTIRGALFDLGQYLAIIEAEGTVRGEVYRLLDAPRLLRRVDAIEGYDHHSLRASNYRRRAVRARLDGDRACEVWVYLYNRALGEAAWVPAGDYRQHCAWLRTMGHADGMP